VWIHVAGRQPAAGCDHRQAGRQAVGPDGAADFPAGLEDGRAAAPVDRAIDAAAARAAAVRGVNDGVDGLSVEVATCSVTRPSRKTCSAWDMPAILNKTPFSRRRDPPPPAGRQLQCGDVRAAGGEDGAAGAFEALLFGGRNAGDEIGTIAGDDA
jgi:hypothetical protein